MRRGTISDRCARVKGSETPAKKFSRGEIQHELRADESFRCAKRGWIVAESFDPVNTQLAPKPGLLALGEVTRLFANLLDRIFARKFLVQIFPPLRIADELKRLRRLGNSTVD